jgi:hypothetical protein
LAGAQLLEADYGGFDAGFLAFFSELISHVLTQIEL